MRTFKVPRASSDLTETSETAESDAVEEEGVPRKGGALVEAEELVERSSGVRARLLEDRAYYLAQVKGIDVMLAKLPGATSPGPAGTPRARESGPSLRKLRSGTIPQLVLSVIQTTPGIMSPQIIAEAQGVKKRLKSAAIYANIYRLQARGLVRSEGTRGSLRYYATASGSTEAQMTGE